VGRARRAARAAARRAREGVGRVRGRRDEAPLEEEGLEPEVRHERELPRAGVLDLGAELAAGAKGRGPSQYELPPRESDTARGREKRKRGWNREGGDRDARRRHDIARPLAHRPLEPRSQRLDDGAHIVPRRPGIVADGHDDVLAAPRSEAVQRGERVVEEAREGRGERRGGEAVEQVGDVADREVGVVGLRREQQDHQRVAREGRARRGEREGGRRDAPSSTPSPPSCA